MTKERIWQNPELTLKLLADKVEIHPKQLSYAINKLSGDNFYNYINYYRIEECKKMLSDNVNSKTSILEIAFSTGFNSKNSFNVAFKKRTGITPSEFRKKNAS